MPITDYHMNRSIALVLVLALLKKIVRTDDNGLKIQNACSFYSQKNDDVSVEPHINGMHKLHAQACKVRAMPH